MQGRTLGPLWVHVETEQHPLSTSFKTQFKAKFSWVLTKTKDANDPSRSSSDRQRELLNQRWCRAVSDMWRSCLEGMVQERKSSVKRQKKGHKETQDDDTQKWLSEANGELWCIFLIWQIWCSLLLSQKYSQYFIVKQLRHYDSFSLSLSICLPRSLFQPIIFSLHVNPVK